MTDWDEFGFDEFEFDVVDYAEEEYPLPKIIQDWLKEASNYSLYNEFPITMVYFNLLGQIMKDFISIPVWGNNLDSRIHFCWFQTQRTGKTALWKFYVKTLKSLYQRINALNHNVEGVIPSDLSEYTIFSVKEYSAASLVGTFRKNEAFDPNQEVDEDNSRVIQIKGDLWGSGIAHWDEFESSGIFTNSKHKENVLMYFQTFMNGLDSESYIITKSLADSEDVLECDCQRSLYATTYVPKNFIEVVANSGALQRAFMYVRDVPEDIVYKMRSEFIDGIGETAEVEMPIEQFANNLTTIYDKVRKRWEKEDKIKENVIKIPEVTKDVIRLYYDKMHLYIQNTRPEVREIAETFGQNFLIYQVVLSSLIAVSNNRFTVRADDVHCAGRLVQNAYSALVVWLEQALKDRRESIVERAKLSHFRQAYDDCEKDEEGWVHKSKYLNEVGKKAKLAQRQVYNQFKNISDKFDTKKFGRSVYIKLKEDEE